MKTIEFNWAYPSIFEPVFKFTGRYILLSGGRSSGKSWFIVHKLLEEAMCEKHDILCVRQYQTNMSQSSHKLFKNVITAYNLPYTVQEKKITCDITGSEIIFIGMDGQTADSIKSYEDFDRVFVEEAQKITIESFSILDPTIRKMNAKLYFGYNPDNIKKCIGQHIMKLFSDKLIHIHSTYLDNPFTNQDTIDQANAYKKNKTLDYLTIWLGQYKTFNSLRVCPDFTEENIKVMKYMPGEDLHLCFDFNHSPNSCIYMHRDSNKYYYFDELIEDLATPKLIKKILNRYPHPGRIVINGDATGNSHKSCSEESDYDCIVSELIRRGYSEECNKNKHIKTKKFVIDTKRGNGNRDNRFKSFNYKVLNPVTGKREILVDPKCEKFLYNMWELEIVPGTSEFKEPSRSQIEREPELRFLCHPFDAGSYPVDYYHPIERLTEPKSIENSMVAEFKKQGLYPNRK